MRGCTAGLMHFRHTFHCRSITYINIMLTNSVSGLSLARAAEEKNAENLLIIKSKQLAMLYSDNWRKHREHAEPYRART
jgi:hypothetical protein